MAQPPIPTAVSLVTEGILFLLSSEDVLKVSVNNARFILSVLILVR